MLAFLKIRGVAWWGKAGLLARIAAAAVAVSILVSALAVTCSFRPGRRELRAGYNNYFPFTMAGSNGRPVGLAIEIVNRAAARAGIGLRWIPVSDSVDEALRKGDVDFMPMLTLTAARRSEFYASQSWWETETALISLEGSPLQEAAWKRDQAQRDPGHHAPVTTLSELTTGKRIAIRGLPLVKNLSLRLFPLSTLVIVPKIEVMTETLCLGEVDAVFLDVRLLQAQLLRGPSACAGHPLGVISVPDGNLSQGTIARKSVAAEADRIYAEIAGLAVDGTLSETAARWSLVSSFRNSRMKDILDEQNRSRIMRYGLAAMTLALVWSWFQTRRIRKARAVADESRQRFDAFMKHTPAVTFIRDLAGRVVYLNDALNKPFQLEPRDVIGQFRVDDSAVLKLNRSVESTETVSLPSGEQRHFLCLKFPFSNSAGQKFVGSIALDITERRKAEEALRFSQFSIDRSPDSILWIDSQGHVVYANRSACAMLGYSREELLALSATDIDAECNWQTGPPAGAESGEPGSLVMEAGHRTKDGSVLPVEVALYHLQFGGRDFTCCISRDITDRKRAEGELSWQAQHDALTGLPNRRRFESLLENNILAAKATGTALCVCYFDLDGFKLINDTLGHWAGDMLLRQLVHRMEGCVREGDTLARMGGDEFTLIAAGVGSEESARTVAGKLLAGLQESFIVDGHELLITASIGISLFPANGLDGVTLLRHADAAMYEAKRQGKNRLQLFNPAMNAAMRERLELENHLRRALSRGELSLDYQPEVSLKSGETVRYEALLRWTNPGIGSVSPSKFIPIAEETGLIVPIGAWVLEEACRQTKCLADHNLNEGVSSETGVSVNVSSVQFLRPDFVDLVLDVLRRTGLPARLLELELTETVVMQNIEDVVQKIALLRDMGVSISIDDFGTGYSSLSYLQKLRIDTLKIDQSFIRDIPFDANALSLTKALVSLAHGLGMKVVVEGVETRNQLSAVRAIGCDMAQGFYLGRPAPASLPTNRIATGPVSGAVLAGVG